MNDLGRFQVVKGYPPIYPNKCSICGRFEGTFIDLGFEVSLADIDPVLRIEFGTIYICIDSCFAEIAASQSYLSPDQFDRLKDRSKALEALKAHHESKIKELEDALGSVTRAISNPVPAVVANVPKPAAIDIESSIRETRPPKPTSIKRPTNVQRNVKPETPSPYDL